MAPSDESPEHVAGAKRTTEGSGPRPERPNRSSAEDSDLLPGDAVGEYIVEGKIGQGGFGSVYKAIHPLIKKRVAIKLLDGEHALSPHIVSRFISEARAVNEIGQKNIIDIFSFGVLGGQRHYFVMEFVEHTLKDLLKLKKRMTLAEAGPILRGLGRALDAAHARGIIHRDLKPSNVLITTDDEGKPWPKLLDFGVAKLVGEDLPHQHKTRTGSPIGTPLYMSPEQSRGEAVDHRSDIYSFGVMSYEMLTGVRPFEAKSAVETMAQHIAAIPAAPSQLVPGLSKAVDEAIFEMLAKEPDQRPSTVAEALQLLLGRASVSGISSEAWVPELHAGPVGAVSSFQADSVGAATYTESQKSVLPVRPTPKQRRFWVLGSLAVVMVGGALWLRPTLDGPRKADEAGLKAASGSLPLASPDPAPQGRTPEGRTLQDPNAQVPPGSAAAGGSPSLLAPEKVPPAAPSVEIAIQGVPKGTRVWLKDGTLLGSVPGVVSLPRGDEPIDLRVEAPGHKAKWRTVHPNKNQRLKLKLTRTRKGRTLKKRKRPVVHEDLETPDF